MSTPLINIHTHQCHDSENICIRNVIAGRDVIPDSEKQLYSYGLHPWFINSRENVETLLHEMNNIVADDQCVMIGECGLDKVCETPMNWQEEVFVRQIHLSEQLGIPMVIHCLKAFEEVLKIRKDVKAKQPWIFHGFGSSPDLAARIIKEGCFLSFGKLIFKDNSKAMASLKSTDLANIFLETDEAGDLSIADIYHQVCIVKSIEMEALRGRIFENYQRLF